MKSVIETEQSTILSGNNDYDNQRDLMNQIKYLFNQEQIHSYNNYDIKTTMELDEEGEKRIEETANIVNEFFNNQAYHNNIAEEEIENCREIYFFTRKLKSKIFLIEKDVEKQEKKGKRKRGRLHKNKIPSYKLKHGKFSTDDIIQKIKRHFINRLLKYINEIYKKNAFKKRKKFKPLLIKINPEKYNVYSNKNNQEFLNKTIGDLFSAETSIRNVNILRKHSQDYNKTQIAFLKKQNKYKEVIKILNLTVKEMYEKYISNEIVEFNLENDLIEVGKKDGDEYKNMYQEIAKELIYLLNKKAEKNENK